MCEQLLGYLLGALEPAEVAALEAQLAADPELRRELSVLRDRLRPFIDEQPQTFKTAQIDPPAGLAERVCARVETVRRTEKVATAESLRPAAIAASWRRVDAATVLGVSLAAMVIIVPVLASQRYRGEAVACRQRLQVVGRALVDYSRARHGFFPEIPAEGNLARAGVYAVKLRESGYLADEADLFCPAAARQVETRTLVPTRAALYGAEPQEAHAMFNRLDGAHGYALGYVEDGRYHALRNHNRPTYAVLGDSPQEHGDGGRNHGCGQNVWFEDGHAEFLKTSRLPGCDDSIYVNDEGYLGAGIGMEDVVIGPADAEPRVTSAMLVD